MPTLICPFCGAENSPGRGECATCGSPLPTTAPAAAPDAVAERVVPVGTPADTPAEKPVDAPVSIPVEEDGESSAQETVSVPVEEPERAAPPEPAPAQEAVPSDPPSERTVPIEMTEETEHHDIPINDLRQNASEQGSASASSETPAAPSPAAEEPAAPEEMLPSADAGMEQAADEESPWLAIGIILTLVILVASGIVFAVSRLGGGDDGTTPAPSSVVTAAPQEVTNLSVELQNETELAVRWTIPAGVIPDGIVVSLWNLSAGGVVVQTSNLPGASTETVIREVSPGSKYRVQVAVKGSDGSVSTGVSQEITAADTAGGAQTRDATRRADLETVQTALAGYAQKKQRYPAAQSYRSLLSRLIADGFLTKPLNDPLSPKRVYEYRVSEDFTGYTLTATLEGEASDAPSGVLTITGPKLGTTPPSIPSTPTSQLAGVRIKTTPTSLTGTAPFKVAFQLQGLPSGATASWNFGNSRTSRDLAPTMTFEAGANGAAAVYTVKATLRMGSETKELTTTVRVAKGSGGANADDTDGDGLTDAQEKEYGTSPTMKDTDQDSFTDKQEIDGGYNPLTPNKDVDSDGDGIMNWEEVQKYKSDPFKADTDNDGFPDGVEVANGYDPTVFNQKK